MKLISVPEVEYLAFRLAKDLLSANEPIPDFSTRFPDVLESCLIVPFQTFGRKNLYHGLVAKAAILFYLMIKNHPFRNGNKRIAVTTLFLFLHKNNKWLKADNWRLYRFARWVAESDPLLREDTVSATEKFISTYLVSV